MQPVIKSLLAMLAGSALLAQNVDAQPVPDAWSGDGNVPSFYRWTSALPHEAGVMLDTEPAPYGLSIRGAARTERILYTSTDWKASHRTITVSGMIFFPEGQPPKGGWPLIAWAHGTTGIADDCAPSVLARSGRDDDYLARWLARGYAIVATDYQGLGTPGVHPYLQFRAEGMSVLDAIRASLAHYSDLSHDKIITMGQSQGSEGAIAAAYLGSGYAPDVKLLGTVATGIVAHTNSIRGARQAKVSGIYLDNADYTDSAFEALWFLGTARTIDPAHIRVEEYLSPDGIKMVKKAQSACMGALVQYAQQQRITFDKFYARPTGTLEALVDENTAFPTVFVKTPVFIGTGLADQAAEPAKQYNFASAMCAAGSVVEMHYYPGADHGGAVARSLADSPRFVDALMHGQKIAGNCSTLEPPVPHRP